MSRRFAIRAGIGFVVVAAAVVGGLWTARARTLATLGTPEAVAEWRRWQADTIRQSETPGPVKRRPAKADEPPMLILLRDHFAAVCATSLAASAIFYGFLVLVVGGSVKPSRMEPQPESTVGP